MRLAQQVNGKMPNRDEYFFDICFAAGLDPSDHRDAVNIGLLFSDVDIVERFVEIREERYGR